ncbi:hypothetical protein [Arhodomonas sp. AD133]|uniref:hypothetical protein n=1 Tax=Arhodomonas sp. AD133 TaxID=3415009 RepID=UPI003EB8E46B
MTNTPQGGLPDATQSVQSTEAVQLLRGHSAAGCEIRPAWDGSDDYVLWIWHIAGGRAQWHVLGHEDGAPLRFRNAARAEAYARKCGFRSEVLSVCWPSPKAGGPSRR